MQTEQLIYSDLHPQERTFICNGLMQALLVCTSSSCWPVKVTASCWKDQQINRTDLPLVSERTKTFHSVLCFPIQP